MCVGMGFKWFNVFKIDGGEGFIIILDGNSKIGFEWGIKGYWSWVIGVKIVNFLEFGGF